MEWRKITIIGGFSLAVFDGLIGMFLYFFDQASNPENPNTQEQTYMLLLTCIGIMGFMFTFGITLGSSVWPYIGIMMPPSGVTLALVINWILAGLSIIAFSFVTASMKNPYVMMWVYCGVTLVTITIFAFVSVDVKGLSVRKVHMQLS
jgi:predicted membrane protein